MTLDASSLPSRMSSGGGVAVKAYDSFTFYGTTGGDRFDHCIVGVAWEIWSHAMWVIVVEACKTRGGTDQNVEQITQRPVGQML